MLAYTLQTDIRTLFQEVVWWAQGVLAALQQDSSIGGAGEPRAQSNIGGIEELSDVENIEAAENIDVLGRPLSYDEHDRT